MGARERTSTSGCQVSEAPGAGFQAETYGPPFYQRSGPYLGPLTKRSVTSSLRLDAALCYGQDAVTEVLSGWEHEAGRPAPDVPYWDAVAALATPPDMAWVAPTIADQGRPDLTGDLLTERRESFLQAALNRLDSGAA